MIPLVWPSIHIRSSCIGLHSKRLTNCQCLHGWHWMESVTSSTYWTLLSISGPDISKRAFYKRKAPNSGHITWTRPCFTLIVCVCYHWISCTYQLDLIRCYDVFDWSKFIDFGHFWTEPNVIRTIQTYFVQFHWHTISWSSSIGMHAFIIWFHNVVRSDHVIGSRAQESKNVPMSTVTICTLSIGRHSHWPQLVTYLGRERRPSICS